MKTIAVAFSALSLMALSGLPASAQEAPKMKMTTGIPRSLMTPNKVETRIGTLKFFDGFPDKATVEKVYDNLVSAISDNARLV